MSSDLIRIVFEEGDDHRPSRLKVLFSSMPWNMAFRSYPAHRLLISREELRRLEARDAVQSFLYMLEREILAALPEHLK